MADVPSSFPPPSTSLSSFLDGESDTRFRKLINDLLKMSSAMLATRERYAQLIGLTPPQYSILMAVADAGQTTVGQLAAELDVSGPFITAQVNHMVKAKLLERAPHPADKRSSLIVLTDKGVALVLKVAPIRKLANDMIFRPFEGRDAGQLGDTVNLLLQQMRAALHKLDEPNLDN
ncbi:MarR family winged helix-turn-helix transcriptional regulator [Rhizobium sp. LEGMi198b]